MKLNLYLESGFYIRNFGCSGLTPVTGTPAEGMSFEL